MPTEKGWAISGKDTRGKRYLYEGWAETRTLAIYDHLVGRTWKECRDGGDRAEKITITWGEDD